MSETNNCPTLDQLERLASDPMPNSEADTLIAHLESCSTCSEVANRLIEKAPLLAELREFRPRELAPVPAELMELVDRIARLGPEPETPSLHSEELPTVSPIPETIDEANPIQLGHYRLVKRLGSGGMGVVYLAEDLNLHRPVAIKIIKADLASRASVRRRFLREARLAAAVRHENVTAIHDVGEDRGIPYMVMEFLEGETLESRLQKQGRLPTAEIIRIGRSIAAGLAAAHAKGLIHRDIKPSNIWLEANTKRVKILDFGLACPIDGEAGFTQRGAILGSPAYMAPEQANNEDTDARTDLFSLGSVLYQTATGVTPFGNGKLMEVLMALATENPKSPRALVPELPKTISQLILKLLDKDPNRRPANADLVITELDRIEAELHRPLPTRRFAWPWLRLSRSSLIASIVLLAVILAILGASGIFRLKSKEGVLILKGLPPDAEITVDGVVVRVTYNDNVNGFEVQVLPGQRRLSIRANGFELLSKEVVIRNGERVPIHLEFIPVPIDPAPKTNRKPVFSRGNWQVQDDVLQQTTENMPCLFLFGDSYGDIDYSAEIWGGSVDSGISLVVRAADDGKNYIYAEVGGFGNTLTDLEFVSPQGFRRLAATRLAAATDRWIPVKLRLRGKKIALFVDGEEVFEAEDDARLQGRVGFRTWAGPAQFRKLLVTAADGKIMWEGLPEMDAP